MKPEKTAGIVRAFDLSMAAPEILDDYGYWHLDRRLSTLTLSADSPSRYEYEIDLESLRTCGEILDIIMQVAGKTWATPGVLGTLVMALNDIFRPQANLCSFGTQKIIHNIGSFLRKRLSRDDGYCHE